MGQATVAVPAETVIKLAAQVAKLESALQAVVLRGHSDDCLFCAHKDMVVRDTLPEWFEGLKLVEDQL